MLSELARTYKINNYTGDEYKNEIEIERAWDKATKNIVDEVVENEATQNNCVVLYALAVLLMTNFSTLERCDTKFGHRLDSGQVKELIARCRKTKIDLLKFKHELLRENAQQAREDLVCFLDLYLEIK